MARTGSADSERIAYILPSIEKAGLREPDTPGRAIPDSDVRGQPIEMQEPLRNQGTPVNLSQKSLDPFVLFTENFVIDL